MRWFTPSVNPAYDANRDMKFKTLVAEFGDGYISRAGDGINSLALSWNLTWQGVEVTVADELETFFLDHMGYIAFAWDGIRGGGGKYLCESYKITETGPHSKTVTAVFRRVYDPGPFPPRP